MREKMAETATTAEQGELEIQKAARSFEDPRVKTLQFLERWGAQLLERKNWPSPDQMSST